MDINPLIDLQRLRALVTPPRYPFPDPAIVYYHPDDSTQVEQLAEWARADGHRLHPQPNTFCTPGQLISSDVTHMAVAMGMEVDQLWADILSAPRRPTAPAPPGTQESAE